MVVEVDENFMRRNRVKKIVNSVCYVICVYVRIWFVVEFVVRL